METSDLFRPCGSSHRFPRRVRDVALQEWAFRCNRDFNATREALFPYAIDEGWDCVPDVRTLRNWHKADDWPGEAARMLRSIAPDMAARAVTEMILAAMDSAAFVRGLAAGTVKPKPGQVMNAWAAIRAVGLDALARGELMAATRGVLWTEPTYQVGDGDSAAASDPVPVAAANLDAGASSPPIDAQAAVLAAVLATRERG